MISLRTPSCLRMGNAFDEKMHAYDKVRCCRHTEVFGESTCPIEHSQTVLLQLFERTLGQLIELLCVLLQLRLAILEQSSVGFGFEAVGCRREQ